MERRMGFWPIFLGGPSSGMLSAFAIGVLVVALWGNLCYDLLVGMTFHWRSVGPVVGVSALLTVLAYALYRRARREVTLEVAVDESRLAPARRGLIWLFGPNYAHLITALRHHREGGGGEHCWLIMQDAPAIRAAFRHCTEALAEAELSPRLYPVYIQDVDARTTYRAVRTLVERELGEAALEVEDVIADLTSGTKPMTTGLVLAALTGGVDLEYVESQRDAEGEVIAGTQRVVLLDMDFYTTENTGG